MSELDDISRQAKEAYIDSKMEQIRQRNKELKQRYEEIEADKQNAEVNSSAALAKQLSQQETGTEKPVRTPKATSNRRKPRQVEPQQQQQQQQQPQRQSPQQQPIGGKNDFSQKRQQRLSEDENPPPDPSYNFLYDRFRVGKESEEQQHQSRRHPSNYGGQDFSNVKNSMQIRKRHEREHPPGPPRNKMEMALTMTGHQRTEYEEWKRIQDQCDKDRVARQKTASGEWRREWDRDKVTQEDDGDRWPKRGGGYRGRGYSRGNASFGRGSQDHDEGRRPRDGETLPVRSRGRGVRRPNAKRYSEGRSDSDHGFPELDSTDRRVSVQKDSIKIRVSNEFTNQDNVNPTSDPIPQPEYTRPPPPRRVGSGRLMSNSSQSEDERVFEERPVRRGKAPFRSQEHKRQANNYGRSNNDWREKREDNRLIKIDTFTSEDSSKCKDTDESMEGSGGGDESWEDVTTSGNESQDLSCPAEDVMETVFEKEKEMEIKVENDIVKDALEVLSSYEEQLKDKLENDGRLSNGDQVESNELGKEEIGSLNVDETEEITGREMEEKLKDESEDVNRDNSLPIDFPDSMSHLPEVANNEDKVDEISEDKSVEDASNTVSFDANTNEVSQEKYVGDESNDPFDLNTSEISEEKFVDDDDSNAVPCDANTNEASQEKFVKRASKAGQLDVNTSEISEEKSSDDALNEVSQEKFVDHALKAGPPDVNTTEISEEKFVDDDDDVSNAVQCDVNTNEVSEEKSTDDATNEISQIANTSEITRETSVQDVSCVISPDENTNEISTETKEKNVKDATNELEVESEVEIKKSTTDDASNSQEIDAGCRNREEVDRSEKKFDDSVNPKSETEIYEAESVVTSNNI